MRVLTGWSGLTLAFALLLSACTSVPTQPKTADEAIDETIYEGVFLAPGADFSPYRRLMVPELEIDAALTVELGAPGYDPASWAMTDTDRRFYRQLYSELAVHQLVAGGGYGMSIDPGKDVLLLVSRLTHVPPPPRSAVTDASVGATGSLTISMELYDSTSGRLLAIITDRRPFGRTGEANNRSVSYHQAREIFFYWIELLHVELDRLTSK